MNKSGMGSPNLIKEKYNNLNWITNSKPQLDSVETIIDRPMNKWNEVEIVFFQGMCQYFIKI